MPQPKQAWYSLKVNAADPNTTEIYIYGDIGLSWYEESITAAEFVKELSEITTANIVIRINSIGGSVPDGLAIYNAIKRHSANVTTCIDGMALSIASLIAMAGDEVQMAKNAMLMIHAPWTYAGGNSAELRKTADVLDMWASAMSSSYADKSGMSVDAVMELLTDGVDHYYTAEDALADGFIDTITEAAPAAAMASLKVAASQRFKSMPQAQVSIQPIPAVESHAAAAAQTKENEMPGTASPAAQHTPAAQKTESQIRAEALQQDAARRDAIGQSFAKFGQQVGVAELLAKCQSDVGMTVEQANAALLNHIGSQASPAAAGHVYTVEDEQDKFRAAGVQALMARAAVKGRDGKPVIAESANPIRGFSLLDLARECLARAGVNSKGMEKMAVVAAAFTNGNSDFPVLLENAMHKTLQAAYALQADTYTRFCAIGSVPDFRANGRYRLGSIGNLDSLDENGEFKQKNVPDGEKATIKADTKGNIIGITRQAIINDDLGAFVGLAAMLGRAAKRTIEADVYALLKENNGLGPIMPDGKTLFHADHGNLGVGAALSVATIEEMRTLMASQMDVSGNDYLDLRPAIWLGPMGVGGTARVINNSEYDPDTAGKLQRPNMVRGLFRDVVDTPRLTGTRSYIFADPMEAPTLEVAFLDGQQEPFIELQNAFDVDGAQYKVRHDFGVAAIDHRGAATNKGAAD